MIRTAVAAVGLATVIGPAAFGGEITVTMSGMMYHPERVQAAVGDTLRFVNEDQTEHGVFVPTAGHALDLGAQEPGEERVLLLRNAGEFEVECVFHPEMHLDVEVR
jgi:plastocyanin